MSSLSRPPRAELLPFVQRVWASEAAVALADGPGARERVLPTGAMHLVFRLGREPLTLFPPARDGQAEILGDTLVGGARASFYVRSVSPASMSVGAQLRPGAARALLGIPGKHLAEKHTSLADVWGEDANRIQARLVAAGSAPERLAIFEACLLARLAREHGPSPLVREALSLLETGVTVAEAVRRSGVSHRFFGVRFREEVGLTPKTYGRIRRFQRALVLLGRTGSSLVSIASECKYSDQAHFTREMAALGGVTPSAYRRLAPASPNHVRIVR